MESINLFKDLENKTIVITGGYGHLGATISKGLALLGSKVYVLARNEEKFKEVFKESENIFFQSVDVSDNDSIKIGLSEINNKNDKIDVLINNAYFGAVNHPEKMSSSEWRKGIDGGLNQVYDCIKAAIPYLKNAENGKIINISSMYGMVVPDLNIYDGREEFLNPPNYGTAKAGVLHLTKYYAMYLAKYNINVNAVSPGPFPSDNVQKDKKFIERLEDKTKLKRIGQPEDLLGIVALLSSKTSNYITGQNIAVDGGWTL